MKSEFKNPFKDPELREEVPLDLKGKVMASVHFSKMVQEFAELFSINMARTVGEMFNNRPASNDEAKSNDTDDVDQS